jgi:glycosyltransferase involved in cell wall biosynthesis
MKKNSVDCDYSIILPIFNERENLIPLHRNIKEVMSDLSGNYEIICIDDGSEDGSAEVLRSIRKNDPRVKLLFFDKNYGQSAALAAGFEEASGSVIVIMDADLQVDAGDIPRLLEELANADMVTGYRRERADSLKKKLTSSMANKIRRKFTGGGIKDTGCPLKVFKREVVKNFAYFDGMHRFFPELALMKGYTVSEVAVTHRKRRYGKSKYNIRNRIGKAFFDLLGVRWMKKRHFRYKIVSRE